MHVKVVVELPGPPPEHRAVGAPPSLASASCPKLWPLAGRRPGTWRREPDDSGRYHSPSAALITDTSQAASSLPRNQPHINSIVKLDSSPHTASSCPNAPHSTTSSAAGRTRRPHCAAHRAAARSGSRGNVRLDALLTTRRRDSLPPPPVSTTRRSSAPPPLRPRSCQPPPPMIARAAVDDSALLSDAPWSSSQHVSTGRCTTADAPTTTPHRNSQPNRDEEPSFLPARLRTSSL